MFPRRYGSFQEASSSVEMEGELYFLVNPVWKGEGKDLTRNESEKGAHLTIWRCCPVLRRSSREKDVGSTDEAFVDPRLDSFAFRDEVLRESLIGMAHPYIEQFGPVLARKRIVSSDGRRIDELGMTVGAGERDRHSLS